MYVYYIRNLELSKITHLPQWKGQVENDQLISGNDLYLNLWDKCIKLFFFRTTKLCFTNKSITNNKK